MKDIYLRKAAGSYWLVKTGDAVENYKNPILLNETGAKMYALLDKGYAKEETARNIANEYNISYEEALEDTGSFINMLNNSGLRE